jgi:hypothetical protein
LNSIPKQSLFVPGLLLLVCVGAFGLMIPFLGFFWDDWMTLYLAHSQSSISGYWYAAFRPLHALLDEAFYGLFGVNPLPWQVLSLALRWLGALLVWRLVLRLWPRRREFAVWVAILFLVYPSFFQQASAVIYRHHWTSFAFYLGSVLLMLARPEDARRRSLNTALGLLSMLAGLLITEYMLGLELLRPLFLWKTLKAEAPDPAARRRVVARAWSPYLALGAAFFVWRTFIASGDSDPNPPSFFFDLAAAPLTTLLASLEAGLRDLVALLWSAWSSQLRPGLVEFSDRSLLLAWLLGLATAAAVWFGLPRYLASQPDQDVEPPRWARAGLLGLAATLAGLSTSWVIGRHLSEGGFSDRFSIPAMLGASLLVCAVIFALVRSVEQRRLVLTLLLVMALAAHLRVGNEYRNDWERQTRFAWQLAERVPTLAAGTTIVADGAVTRYLSRYNAAFMLNLLYPAEGEGPAYWYEELYVNLQHAVDDFGEGVPIEVDQLGIQFSGNTTESLVLVTEPGDSICLWVLGPLDEWNYTVEADLRQIGPHSALDTISDGPGIQPNPPLFGPPPDPYWCTYFQQASLAYQYKDWERILGLWEAAQQGGFSAYDGHEYLPFIEGLAASDRWQEAAELSLLAYQQTSGAAAAICVAWDRFEASDPDAGTARQLFSDHFSCEAD